MATKLIPKRGSIFEQFKSTFNISEPIYTKLDHSFFDNLYDDLFNTMEYTIPEEFSQQEFPQIDYSDLIFEKAIETPQSIQKHPKDSIQVFSKTSTQVSPKDSTQVPQIIKNIINTARKYLKWKYKPGGINPKQGGFDCSGLLYYIFNSNGVKLPGGTHAQFKAGKEVSSLSQAKVGDIICTPGTGESGKHVKIISKIVDGQIYTIEAKGRQWGIVETPLKKTNNIITIRRIVG